MPEQWKSEPTTAMNSFVLNNWLRENIRDLKPYSSARDEFDGEAMVFLDANESPFDTDFNRYPDPHQKELKSAISSVLDIPASNIFVGNGSDEAIDLLIRASCNPGQDRILTISPSYGMYTVCAAIQGVEVDTVLLNADFSLNTDRLVNELKPNHKLVFLCSPNNPTGNVLNVSDVAEVLKAFSGIVVLDEAYIDFANDGGLVSLIDKFQNLVILRTFSKAWGMAGARCGLALSQPGIIQVLDKIKYPYNINSHTQKLILEALKDRQKLDERINILVTERGMLVSAFKEIPGILEIFPSEANFILIKVESPDLIYQSLLSEGIVVRNRNRQPLCQGCLRISIGVPEENQLLLKKLKELLT